MPALLCDCKKNFLGKVPTSLHWGQNSKLRKDKIIAFNLPADEDENGIPTCPNAGICKSFCYAKQGRYNFPNVAQPRQHNFDYLLSLNDDYTHFTATACQDLATIKQKYKKIRGVRIHDSGDMFSRNYFRAWVEVAKKNPDIIFYAYTKMILLFHEIMDDWGMPDNMRIVQSVGGKQDKYIDATLPHSKVFPTQDALDASEYVDGTHSDMPAYHGEHMIGLVYHGTKVLGKSTKAVERANNLVQLAA